MNTAYANPSNWRAILGAIPDDGSHWTVHFEDGAYPNISPFSLDHRSGGSISLRAINKHGPYFTSVSGVGAIYIACPSVTIDGLAFIGTSYFATSVVSGIGFFIGSRLDDSTFNVCFPTNLVFINCFIVGASMRLFAKISTNSPTTTAVLFKNIVIRNSGVQMVMNVTADFLNSPPSSGDGGYCNAVIDNVDAVGINGPENLSDGGPTTSSHGGGTGALELSGLDGSSTVLIKRWRSFAEVRGSNNHDMHAIRFIWILSAAVRITIQDAHVTGHWRSGHFRTLFHLFYHHENGPNFPTEGARPRYDIENCYFSTAIGKDVSLDETSSLIRDLCRFYEDADVHFWDCSFELDYSARPEFIEVGENRAVTIVATTKDASIWFHSCTFDLPAGADKWVLTNPVTQTNVVVLEDAETRSIVEPRWQRV